MSESRKEQHSILIKNFAYELGFDLCGISKADFLEEEAPKLEAWLNKGFHGTMHYLERNFDKRLDPRKLVEGAKSVISLAYNYYPEEDLSDADCKIAKYAYGEDYHFVIKRKLKTLVEKLREQIGDIEGRAFVDSAPVHERAWAQKSGLGWVGKNSLLLSKNRGSYFFLAELIIDLELKYDNGVGDYCGTCTKCMDACPTDAIPEPYMVDGSRCISYLTIELKDSIPEEFAGKHEKWIFGCDICQDVCPWNRFSKPHNEDSFIPHKKLGDMRKADWEELTEEVFGELFRKSAIKRTKFKGLKRNIEFLNSK